MIRTLKSIHFYLMIKVQFLFVDQEIKEIQIILP